MITALLDNSCILFRLFVFFGNLATEYLRETNYGIEWGTYLMAHILYEFCFHAAGALFCIFGTPQNFIQSGFAKKHNTDNYYYDT